MRTHTYLHTACTVCAKYPSRHTAVAAPARFESADIGAKTGGGAKEEAKKFESTATRGRGAAAGTGGVRLTNSEGMNQHITAI
jgi:hypothetical protein